jgi:hypothetical protein
MTRWRLRSEGLQWREIDGETVVVDVPESLYLAANPAGTLLWGALAEGASVAALAALLVDTYGIDRERAEADAVAFVARLAERKLVVETDA